LAETLTPAFGGNRLQFGRVMENGNFSHAFLLRPES
jgi:hypothetical protein